MTLYDYTKCPQCKASIAKSARTCPICGREQGAGVNKSPSAAPARTPASLPYSNPYKNPYKAPATPLTSYAPATSLRKNSDAVMILGGVLATGVCVACLITVTHKNTSAGPPGTPAVMSAPSTPDASPDSRSGMSVTTAPTAVSESHTAIAPNQAVGVIVYCDVVDSDAELLGNAMTDLAKEFDQATANPQLYSDQNWKASINQKAAQVTKSANALQTIMVVPPECVPMHQKVQQFCMVCDSAARYFADGATSANAEAMQKAMIELSGAQPLIGAIESEEKSLKARCAN